MIYTLTRLDADTIRQYLNIPVYHPALSIHNQTNSLSAWTTGGQRWIVSTSGHGVEINLPNIKLVVIWGLPNDIIDFIQMSGRAGRELEQSLCIIV
ncbi:P-loop containing nucleoside triphosphate hydrolase protein, partial [Trichophaea hybrida]